MSGTYLNSSCGYIADVGATAAPEPLSAEDTRYLRELAKQVRAVGEKPIQEKRRALWYAHNALEKTRPLFILYPEDGWIDLIPAESLRLQSPFWRNYEWYLRHLLYRDAYIADDFIIEPVIHSPVDFGFENGAFGLSPAGRRQCADTGAWVNEPMLRSYDQLPDLKFQEFFVNETSTQKRYDALREVFDGYLPVEQNLTSMFLINQPGTAALLRGIEQLMLDMYDEPENVHALMRFLTDNQLHIFRQMEASGYLTDNNGNHYVASGGTGHRRQAVTDPTHVRLSDLWGFGVAQEFSEISPAMHQEFGVQYQNEVMALFGANSYGCCEPYTHKFDILKSIPNLRRVSVSPWCDIDKAREKLGRDVIFSWKPNPAVLLFSEDMESVRAYLRRTIETCDECALEILLKDIIHLRGMQDKIPQIATIITEELQRRGWEC